MSGNSKAAGDVPFEDYELSQIEIRWKELRKERDALRQSQYENVESIKRLELNVTSLLDSRAEDNRKLQKLEEELLNRSRLIGNLRVQLSARNEELTNLKSTVCHLERKLAEFDALDNTVFLLRNELQSFVSENLLLKKELRHKEMELRRSYSSVQTLEESISSLTLESECEIESLKLDLIAMEQSCCEAKKLEEMADVERHTMTESLKCLEARLQDSENCREKKECEIADLKKKLDVSGRRSSLLISKIDKWITDNQELPIDSEKSAGKLDNVFDNPSAEESAFEPDLENMFSKLRSVLARALKSKEQAETMAVQLCENEAIVTQLKEELRVEKIKSKEDAEDLAQEMAELRYQTTVMLEQECKRRACIEHASLQRIAELEAEIQRK